MKRTLLSLLSILMLALAGSVFAQTDYGSTDQPADTTATSPSVESAPPQGTSGEPSGSSMPMNSAPSQTEGSSPQPSSATTAPTHESLPATASDLPLALAIGLSALGAAVALRAYRLRSSH